MTTTLKGWRGLAAAATLATALLARVTRAFPTATSPPPAVLWYAPFLSGGGYCSEAHSYVEAIDLATQARKESALRELQRQRDPDANANDAHLHAAASGSDDGGNDYRKLRNERTFSLFVTQHGDAPNAAFIRDLPEEMRERLQEHWIEEHEFHWRLQKTRVALAVCHSEPGAWHPARYKTSRCPPPRALYTVGRTMFETDRVPSGWADRMNKMDEIWVPTKFQQKIFVDGGVRPESIYVLPEAVDVHFFDPATVDTPYDLASEVMDHAQITHKTSVFLSVFKWEERKAWRVLLRAYFQAFTAHDDVALVILTSAYHTATESAADFMQIVEEFATAEMGKPLRELPFVYVMPPQLPQHQLPAMYKAATAFVLPSRGEGWGRPHVEAMAMALPIISTFWSGTTEYMTEDNSYPLRIDGLVEIKDGAFRGHKWAEPSVSHLVELLQRVHRSPEEAREKGQQGRRDMVAKYSPEVIGKVLLEHIERVLALAATRELQDADVHDEL